MNRKITSILMSFSLIFSIVPFYNVSAIVDDSNNLDDYTVAKQEVPSDHEITTVDENGNVISLETVEQNMPDTSDDLDEKDLFVQPEEQSRARASNSSVSVVNFRTKSSSKENTEYKEDGTNRDGYTNGYYAADAAFLGYDNEVSPTKVKFMQSGVIGWVNLNEVEVLDYTSSSVQTLSKYYVKNGRLYHGISTKLSNTAYSSNLDCGVKPSYLKDNTDYYSYDGHYFYEGSTYSSYKTMLEDYKTNVRTHSVNSSNPYYNYYQYLSHRSLTTYNASQLNQAISYFSKDNSKMRNEGNVFISNQNTYGTNAMLMIGVAANESSWGSSNIAQNKNNLFGHHAYDKDPNGSANGYSSVDYSIYYHSAIFLSKGYLDPITDYRYYGAFLGDKASGIGVKYASDPYWGEKAASICWKVDNYLGGTDSKKYTIGIKDTLSNLHSVVNIKNSSNTNSTTLYSTYPTSSKISNKTLAPSNFAFLILKDGKSNGDYKIQSDGSIDSTRSKIVVQSEYNYDSNYAYIPTNSITIVSNGSNSSSQLNTSNVEGQPTGKTDSEPTLYYQSNCQNVGWLNQVNEPNTTGTTGRSLNLYQLKFDLKNANPTAYLSGKIYNSKGWKTYDKINNDTVVGDESSPIQVINFSANCLTGYKLQYRVHSADIGWQSWIDEGNNAGVSGKNIQAIDFRIVKDSSLARVPGIYYSQHLSNIGWTDNLTNGNGYGNTSENLEALKIGVDNLNNYNLTIKTLDTQNKNNTYTNVTNSTVIGSTGQSLGLKMINMSLSNSNNYELKYRAYIDGNWTKWISQGNDCGSKNTGIIKDIQIKLVYVSHITSVTLNKSSLSLSKGNTETLQATINPSDTTDAKTLTWKSEDENIAKVDGNGKVTGVGTGTTNITVITSNRKSAACKVTVVRQTPSVNYSTHVQDIGWQGYVKDGSTAGTTGQSKRLEAIRIKLSNNTSYNGTIQYQTHIQDIGWQGWKTNDEMSGTSGQSKRLEAIRIKLTDELAENYDIYYRVHAQEFGWLDWAKNGEESGTAGYSYRLEGIEIKLVEKDGKAPGSTERPYVQRYIGYKTHVQDYGWQGTKYDGQTSGTSGQCKRLEAIQISLSNPLYSGSIQYQTHVQDYGWQSWKADGQTSGTSGQCKRLEAIKIKLTGQMAEKYDIYYRVHAQDYGWLGWAKNGSSAGTEGMSKRLEAIEIKLIKKGGSAPGSTANSYYKK